MAKSLRDQWKDAKGASLLAFKNDTKVENSKRNLATDGPLPYPIKFAEDLGPALDKWAAAKKPEDKLKYKKLAMTAIELYRKEIKAKLAGLSKMGAAALTNELIKIEKQLNS